jgi:hypothetical protein
MTLADRFLRHAQALENQAMFLEQEKKLPIPAKSHRATASLLREAAAELKK